MLYSSLELWPVLLVQKRNCCYFIGDKYLPCVGNDVCMYSPRGINVYFSWIWLILRGNSLCIICSFPNSTIVHAMKKWNLLLKRSNVFCELVHYSYRRLLLSTENRSFDLSISYERQVGVSFKSLCDNVKLYFKYMLCYGCQCSKLIKQSVFYSYSGLTVT